MHWVLEPATFPSISFREVLFSHGVTTFPRMMTYWLSRMISGLLPNSHLSLSPSLCRLIIRCGLTKKLSYFSWNLLAKWEYLADLHDFISNKTSWLSTINMIQRYFLVKSHIENQPWKSKLVDYFISPQQKKAKNFWSSKRPYQI